MKIIYLSPSACHIALSRRNLLKLLQMLDNHVSQPTLSKRDAEANAGIHVTAEEDADHYPTELAALRVGNDWLTEADVVELFNRWRVTVSNAPGGFSHSDGLRFLQMLRETVSAQALPCQSRSPE